MVIASLLPYVASTGIASSVLYYSSPHNEGPSRTLATALPFGLAQSMLFGFGAWLTIPLLIGKQGTEVVADGRLALLTLPPALFCLYIQSALQAQLRFKAFNFLRVLLPIGSLVGVVALEAIHALSGRNIIIVYIAVSFVALLWGISYAVRSGLVIGLRPQRSVARRLVVFGFKAQVGELANAVNVRLDQVLIAAWLPAEELGLYVAALSATQLVSMLAYSIRVILQPRLLNETGEHQRYLALKRGICRYTGAGAVTSLALVAAVPTAIPLLFGGGYRAAILPSQILVGATFLVGYKTILAGAAQAYGNPWLASRAELAGVVVTVVAMVALLPRFGILGAAVASVVAYATQSVLLAIGLRKVRVGLDCD